MKEKWKKIKGYPRYSVSNLGRVRNDITGKILKGSHNPDGYMQVKLTKKKHESKYIRVHRLVAQAFIPNPENKPQVNHIDGIRDNNIVTNLEWVTNKENSIHSWTVLGRTVTDEWRNNIKKSKQHISDDTRKRMSEGQKRRNLIYDNNPNAKKVMRIEDEKIYDTMKEAAEDVGIDYRLISATCHGEQRTAGGYHWCFI